MGLKNIAMQITRIFYYRAWFVKGRHWHAGVEGRISVIKRAPDLGRCLAHGLNGFPCWAGWGVITGNLAALGRT